jgi:hypothetical protein
MYNITSKKGKGTATGVVLTFQGTKSNLGSFIKSYVQDA